ncbi:MAG: LysE family translocator [Chromatiaceae bacterium]|nr:LysE family translocator [Chromatiaceae bacterium]
MGIESWLAFVIASVVLLVIPGPTILAVISYSITHGSRANLPLVVGVALGDSTALFASTVGLGALLSISANWFLVVKVAGGLYLIYLGIKLFRTGLLSAEPIASDSAPSRLKLFASTYFVTAFNPKGIVFFMAFLPQFITPGLNSTYQMWLLSCTFVALATINAALYTFFASSARLLLTSNNTLRRFNYAGGMLLSTAGVWALLSRRPAM